MIEEIIHPIGGVNQDAALAAMPKGDYPYSLNCIRKESGEYGTITNALGNELVTVTLPAGTNEVIGQCEDKEDQAVIYFLYNSNDDHCIIRYRPISDEVEFLLEDEDVLNFSTDYKIFNPQVIGSLDEKLLFWTDNYNPPRKLNVEEAYYYTNDIGVELDFVFGGLNQLALYLMLPYGKKTTIHWGNGDWEDVWGEGDVLILRSSALIYTVPDTYTVTMGYGTKDLTWLDISGSAAISGDVSGWGDFTNLVEVLGDNTNWGFASSIPIWSNDSATIDFNNCAWIAAEVDNCLIALANGPVTNCTIDIAGTNAARTAASNAAMVILIANGNIVTVN